MSMLKFAILALPLALWSAATGAQALVELDPDPAPPSFESQVQAAWRLRVGQAGAPPQGQSRLQLGVLSLCFWRADLRPPGAVPAGVPAAAAPSTAGVAPEAAQPFEGALYLPRRALLCDGGSLFDPDDPGFEPAPSAAVPEPAAPVLLLGGLALLVRRLR